MNEVFVPGTSGLSKRSDALCSFLAYKYVPKPMPEAVPPLPQAKATSDISRAMFYSKTESFSFEQTIAPRLFLTFS